MDRVNKVNELLKAGEPKNVQVKEAFSARGRTLYGYIPQAILDAVNTVYGASGFTSTVMDLKIGEKQVIARVEVGLWDTTRNVWNTHEQAGEMQIILSDTGSAAKGAITDATEKALGMFSIGNRAYLGQLDPKKDQSYSQAIQPSINYAKEITKLKTHEEAKAFYKVHVKEIKAMLPEARQTIISTLSKIGGTK